MYRIRALSRTQRQAFLSGESMQSTNLLRPTRGCYVKSYLLGDNNYQTAPEEDQLIIYKGWKKLLNSFGSNMEAAIIVNNHSINMQEFCEKVLHKETRDGFDDLRKVWNDMSHIGSSAMPIPLVEQLDLLYGIYNDLEEHLVQKSQVVNEDGRKEEISSFDYDHMRGMDYRAFLGGDPA